MLHYLLFHPMNQIKDFPPSLLPTPYELDTAATTEQTFTPDRALKPNVRRSNENTTEQTFIPDRALNTRRRRSNENTLDRALKPNTSKGNPRSTN
jgi:hypothetical protein